MFSKVLALASLALLATAAPVPSSSQVSGSGILMANKGTLETEYCFFENQDNGNGWAVPGFDNPTTCVTLAPGASQFVTLDKSFKGRVQRGKELLGTWAEFQLQASDDGKAHGDISVEQGNDGGATIESFDEGYPTGGFDFDIVPEAPAAATTTREGDGQGVIASTMGNWLAGVNQAAVDYQNSKLDSSLVYVTGGTGVKDVASSNNAMKVTWY